jgi:hypothetical protein
MGGGLYGQVYRGPGGCPAPAVTVITDPGGARSLWADAVSACEQDGDEHVG